MSFLECKVEVEMEMKERESACSARWSGGGMDIWTMVGGELRRVTRVEWETRLVPSVDGGGIDTLLSSALQCGVPLFPCAQPFWLIEGGQLQQLEGITATLLDLRRPHRRAPPYDPSPSTATSDAGLAEKNAHSRPATVYLPCSTCHMRPLRYLHGRPAIV